MSPVLWAARKDGSENFVHIFIYEHWITITIPNIIWRLNALQTKFPVLWMSVKLKYNQAKSFQNLEKYMYMQRLSTADYLP